MTPASAGAGSRASAGAGSHASAGAGSQTFAGTGSRDQRPAACPALRPPAALAGAGLAGAPAAHARGEPGPLRNGHPRENPALAPRCGAKARTTGCPCQGPAMANGRCRMHGGNCRGPATPEGRARMIKANTKHGAFTAAKRADQLYVRTLIIRSRLLRAARHLWRYLPPDMAARLAHGPDELAAPIHPSNLPFLAPQDAMPCEARPRARQRRDSGLRTGPAADAPQAARTGERPTPPTGRAAERVAARAEAAALAPWRQAIAFARQARRAARQARRVAREARAAARKTQSAGRDAIQSLPSGAPAAPPGGENAAHAAGLPGGETIPASAPGSSAQESSLLEREVAARAAGLRGRGCIRPDGDPARRPQAESAFPGHNALQRLPPGACPGGLPPSAPPGGEPAAPPGDQPSVPASGQIENPGRNAVHRRTAAPARPSAPTPAADTAPDPLRAAIPVRSRQTTPSTGQNENPGRNAVHRRTAAPARPAGPAPAADTAPDPLRAAIPVRSRQTTPSTGQNENPGRNAVHGQTAAPARPTAPAPAADTAPDPSCAAIPVRSRQTTPSGGKTENPGRNALQRLPTLSLPPGLTRWGACPGGQRPAAPPLTRRTPTKAAALRSTSLATAWNSGMTPLLAACFGPRLPAPGWRVPQAMPAGGPVAAALDGLQAAQQSRAR